ncbi:uncharacterized protein WM294_008597 isoform 3-T4 [Sarcoramphus papa]
MGTNSPQFARAHTRSDTPTEDIVPAQPTLGKWTEKHHYENKNVAAKACEVALSHVDLPRNLMDRQTKRNAVEQNDSFLRGSSHTEPLPQVWDTFLMIPLLSSHLDVLPALTPPPAWPRDSR